MPDTTIAAGKFAVVVNNTAVTAAETGIADGTGLPLEGLEDLEAFFSTGGTIELRITTDDADDAAAGMQLDDAYADGVKPKMFDLVISEIMWGLDDDADTKQWIEIYNTTDHEISIGTATASTKDRCRPPSFHCWHCSGRFYIYPK